MKKLITTLFILQYTLLFSQQFYRAEYKYTDKDNFTTKSYLYTNNKEATFKIEDNRKSGEEVNTYTGALDFVDNDSLSRFSYSDLKESVYRFVNRNEEIIYSDDLTKKLNWTILTDNKKKIGDYNCIEAKTKLNGRNYTAWFTFDVPLKFGPLKFHNLPGLIVELKENNSWLKIELSNFSKTKDTKYFNKIKKYVLSKKASIKNYTDFEKTVTENEITILLKSLAKDKEYFLKTGNTMEFNNFYIINTFLDIPHNLLYEMEKYNK